jgi:hypothetical protein
VAIICWSKTETLPECGGKVLARVKTAGEGDVGDGARYVFSKHTGGMLQAALVQVFNSSGVHQLPAVFAESRDSHAALSSHLRQCPRFVGTRPISGKISKK